MPWVDDADNHEKLEDVDDGIAKKASEVGEEIVEKEKLDDIEKDVIRAKYLKKENSVFLRKLCFYGWSSGVRAQKNLTWRKLRS